MNPIDFLLCDPWRIRLNKLYRLDPDDSDVDFLKLPSGVTVWDIYFVQDLFQATNLNLSLLLDIGWYPDGAPEGHFSLRLLSKESAGDSFDWEHPIMCFRTRSIVDLESKVREIISVEQRRG